MKRSGFLALLGAIGLLPVAAKAEPSREKQWRVFAICSECRRDNQHGGKLIHQEMCSFHPRWAMSAEEKQIDFSSFDSISIKAGDEIRVRRLQLIHTHDGVSENVPAFDGTLREFIAKYGR